MNLGKAGVISCAFLNLYLYVYRYCERFPGLPSRIALDRNRIWTRIMLAILNRVQFYVKCFKLVLFPIGLFERVDSVKKTTYIISKKKGPVPTESFRFGLAALRCYQEFFYKHIFSFTLSCFLFIL